LTLDFTNFTIAVAAATEHSKQQKISEQEVAEILVAAIHAQVDFTGQLMRAHWTLERC
jgi:hypothetical protein